MSDPSHNTEARREATVFTEWESMRQVMGLCTCSTCWGVYLRALEAPHYCPVNVFYPLDVQTTPS